MANQVTKLDQAYKLFLQRVNKDVPGRKNQIKAAQARMAKLLPSSSPGR
jgi:hypothetical protein